jgi:DNA-directed RNA polymerase subunit RPC12/RpoP
METQAISCNHCGAPLQVPSSTRFVTCGHCGSQLRIERSKDAIFTEVLEDMRATQTEMAADLETLRLQNELERIDREWDRESRRYEIVDNDGRRSTPGTGSSLAAILGGGVVVVFLIFWISMASQMGAPSIFPLFGGVALIAAVFGIFRTLGKSSAYAAAEQKHRQRRNRLLAELRKRGALHEPGNRA